ncbi:MAG: NADPH-dependent 7-cyano-7-deazaguanine reductase QueF [Gammaproteobacteria bacterium]
MSSNPLGESIPSPSKYDPGILYPISRWPARSLLDIDKKIPMHGFDHWHAYELSWVNSKGKPLVAVAEFLFNADSENIVESKSLKLYLNSLSQEAFDSSAKLSEVIANDLSAVSKSEVQVKICGVEQESLMASANQNGKLIDSLDIEIDCYEPDESLLKTTSDVVFDEELRSDLFRSNCPVTGAPDWASVGISYTGAKIDEASLLSYLCSFRQHQGYHEECAERIYRDITVQCAPEELRVVMNFLRRGGLDINVYRSSEPISSDVVAPRSLRQ